MQGNRHCHTEISVERRREGRGGGGPAEETSWLTTLAEKHSFNTLPETYPTLMMLTTTNSACASRPTTDH